jgi:Repeat of unknown function (DUF5648)
MNRIARTTGITKTMMIGAAFAGLVLASVAGTALATDVRLVSYVAYSYTGNMVDLSTDGIVNMDPANDSQRLRLELWAFAAPYVAGMDGIRLATAPLEPLVAGSEVDGIDSGPVAFMQPPNGVWYYSMLLTEYAGLSQVNEGYVPRYWINFQAPVYIGVPPPPKLMQVVEFYNMQLDHYFITASAFEINDLDTGGHPGWVRTGYSFNVWDGMAPGLTPVCRYYIPPSNGDSHFYSASPYECGIAPSMFPWIIKETDSAFYIGLPDADTGACAANEVPVYRLWDARPDADHRYTTSTAIKAAMIAKGYIAEGYGPDQVGMCASQ